MGRAISAGLRPILCLDDALAETATRRGGDLHDEWAAILAGAASVGIDREALRVSGLILAYEPVGAIGSGTPLAPSAAQAAAAALRTVSSADLPVLYGGSIGEAGVDAYLAPTSDTAARLDGLLVGGASLAPARLAAILATLCEARR